MTMLTNTQITTAAKADLVATYDALHRHLHDLSEELLIMVAKEVLVQHGFTDDFRITFETMMFDDGDYYTQVDAIEDVWGAEMAVPHDVLDALDLALQNPLTQLSWYDTRLGREDIITLHSFPYSCGTSSRWRPNHALFELPI